MIGAQNKRKGSDAERYYAKIFKNLGFSYCVTSRYGSRIHDDAGIDLINLPFNVQIKAGKQKNMNVSKVLHEITNRIKNMFPSIAPEHNRPLVLIHRKEVGRGRKRNNFHDIVSMSFEDFKKIINLIEKEKWD